MHLAAGGRGGEREGYLEQSVSWRTQWDFAGAGRGGVRKSFGCDYYVTTMLAARACTHPTPPNPTRPTWPPRTPARCSLPKRPRTSWRCLGTAAPSALGPGRCTPSPRVPRRRPGKEREAQGSRHAAALLVMGRSGHIHRPHTHHTTTSTIVSRPSHALLIPNKATHPCHPPLPCMPARHTQALTCDTLASTVAL